MKSQSWQGSDGGERSFLYFYVDHTVKCPINTGMQRVVRGLSRSLMEVGERLRFVKWDDEKKELVLADRNDLAHLARWIGPTLTEEDLAEYPEADAATVSVSGYRAGDAEWLVVPEVTYINFQSRPVTLDVIMAAKRLGLKSAFVFHDATPFLEPEFVDITPKHVEYMQQLLLADLIVPVSEWASDDLGAFFEHHELATVVTEPKIVALPLPGEAAPFSRVTTPSLADRKLILSVGSITPHKNQIVLLHAYEDFVRRHPKAGWELILVGNIYHNLAVELEAARSRTPSIKVLTNISDEELHRLYEDCAFTVFPSKLEGFGLPILESLWHGKPCLCANFGAMAEVAREGGCLMVDVRRTEEVLSGIETLAYDRVVYSGLQEELAHRPLTRWTDYARDFLGILRHGAKEKRWAEDDLHADGRRKNLEVRYRQFMNLVPRPLLSICISTYNRARWLELNLRNMERLLPTEQSEIEVVVCDNTSTDHTPEVVKPYLGRRDFRYYRNPKNVGMLGNLQVTAHHARGRHVWIIGDDDLLMPGSVRRVTEILRKSPDLPLVYLNYAYTNEDNPEAIADLESFFAHSTPIVAPAKDIDATVREISTESENFFTAIYCLVFRRDHALRAYSQNTEGRPFSTMLTTIPTTHYVLTCMMEERGYWVGEPQVVVNMNVSWMKYATLWILERIPEMLEYAEDHGADSKQVDRWRVHFVPSTLHFFREIYGNDPEGNREYFSPTRLISRLKHLDEFRKIVPELRDVYEKAHQSGVDGAEAPPGVVFADIS